MDLSRYRGKGSGVVRVSRREFLGTAAALPISAKSVSNKVGHANAAKYRACVIGDTRQGGYGHNLHLMWELRPDVEVVGLADPDDEGRARRAREARAQRTYADFREMLEKERPDLVSVGPRWTIHHRDYLLACAAVGAHGLIEKPLAVDMLEAEAMLEATRPQRLKWAVAFNYRASPVFEHVRRMVTDEGLIGDLLEIRSRGKEDQRAGGEDLIVLGVHCFDMMARLAGPPHWCSASISENGRLSRPGDVREATEPLGPVVGTRLEAAYGFAGGVNGYFSSARNRDGDGGRWGVDLYGSKGVVTVRMTQIPTVGWLPEPSWSPGAGGGVWKPIPGLPEVSPGSSSVWHYAPIVNDLITAVKEDRFPLVSLEDGALATAMIQAAFESHVQGGLRVEIPLARLDHPLRRWQ